ncbi:MAG TPA: 4-amino-4-deoxy-L-arabinose transferase [Isosphaeraceae bacterium]|nr:4-amino-4-deoxy-L-arabinose transferase [Isosphaeraceae bacterium]
MIDLAFAAFLSLVCLGTGKRILDRFGQAPEHPLDAVALAMPLGMGLMALGTLALGELGWLTRRGLAGLLALLIGQGLLPAFRLLGAVGDRARTILGSGRTHWSATDRVVALCLGTALLGTAMVATGPVTDGDALCYHLQVPKVFLTQGSVGFDPDLHETVYPLVTELIDAPALAFRGPVACRWLAWALGLSFAANVTALARPSLGGRAWWAGAIAMLVPAVSNGMSAPLNDVPLAAFGTAALVAWTRLLDRPGVSAAVVAGIYAGLAIGVKYPALVLCALLVAATPLGGLIRRSTQPRPWVGRWLALTTISAAATVLVGGWWYLRAYHHTGNPVYPFFRQAFGGSGLDEVLAPVKRPMAVTAWNLLLALGPLSLQPDRFDSFAHQFGPVFLLFLPAALLEGLPRRVLGLAGLAYLFLILCLTQRQSTRFVLIALGPLAIAVAAGASAWSERTTVARRLMMAILLAALGLEAGLALARSRQVLGLVTGRESAPAMLARREPTAVVGDWVARHLPPTARLIGQDHRGFYIPRPYTMELAHRRRTGLGRRGESPGELVARLCRAGFTHLMLCPPVPETAVEFDPTLGRLLAAWLAGRRPIYRADLTDGDGVLRRYAIYELSQDRLAAGPSGGHTR